MDMTLKHKNSVSKRTHFHVCLGPRSALLTRPIMANVISKGR